MKIWYEDENVRYESLTRQRLSDVAYVMNNSFFLHESTGVALDLENNSQAIQELQCLISYVANDGISIIAIDKKTEYVVGVALNKLWTKNHDHSLETFKLKATNSAAKAFLDFMVTIDNDDIFFNLPNFTIDCVMEIVFLAVLPDHRGMGIAQMLHQLSVDFGKQLVIDGNGIKTKVEIDLSDLPAPKIITAFYTSPVSSHIGKKLGFQFVKEVDLNKWQFNGKGFADILEHKKAKNISKVVSYAYLKL